MKENDHTTTRREFWRSHIEACTASGGTIKDYAAQHGLSLASLYAARRRYVPRALGTPAETDAQSRARLTQVGRLLTSSPSRVGCRARLANGAMVELDLEVGDLEGRALLALGHGALRAVDGGS